MTPQKIYCKGGMKEKPLAHLTSNLSLALRVDGLRVNPLGGKTVGEFGRLLI